MNPRRLASSVAQVILYGVLSIAFALLSFWLKDFFVLNLPNSPYSIGFSLSFIRVFLIAVSLLCAVPVILFVLRDLRRLGYVPRVLREKFPLSPADDAGPTHPIRLPDRVRLRIALVGAILMITLFVTFVQRTGIVDDNQTSSTLHSLTALVRDASDRWQERSRVVVSRFVSRSSDLEQHLADLLMISRMLKAAGVRALLIPLPVDVKSSSPSLASLDSLGVVVFGMHPALLQWSYGDTTYLRGAYSTEDRRALLMPSFSEINMVPELGGVLRPNQTDVLVAWLLQYRDLDRETILRISGGMLVVGEDRIPLTDAGTFISRNRYKPMASDDIGVMRMNADQKELYISHWDARQLADGTPAPSLTVEELRTLVNAKAVILASSFDRSAPHLPIASRYASAFENILSGNFLSRPQFGFVWFTVGALLLCAVIAYSVRPLLAAAVILLMSIVSLYVGSVLYSGFHLLIEMHYPLMALGIASFTFPLLKFAFQRSDHER